MRVKVLPVVLLAMMLVVGACSGDDDGGGGGVASGPGLILCSEVGELGEPLDGLIVLTPEGERVRTIAGGRLMPRWVAGNSSKALYYDFRGDDLFLIDAATGSKTAISDDLDLMLPWYSTERFIVAGKAPAGGALVDLERGTVYDLAELFGLSDADDVVHPVPDFDAAEEQVLITILSGEWGVWLVPTAAPEQARLLGTEARTGALNDAGDRVVFFEDGIGNVGAADGDSFTSFGSDLMWVEFVDGGILATDRDSLLLYDEDGGGERVLWEVPGTLSFFRVNDGGRWAVVGFWDDEAETQIWLVVNARERQATEMGGLDGLQPLFVGDGYALFAGRSAGFEGIGNFDRVAVIDLAGAAVIELPAPVDGVVPHLGSPDGNRHLMRGRDGWLLVDLPGATITLLPGDLAGVSFSPDGERVVMARWDGEDRATVDLIVAEVEALGVGTSLGVACESPVWVAGG